MEAELYCIVAVPTLASVSMAHLRSDTWLAQKNACKVVSVLDIREVVIFVKKKKKKLPTHSTGAEWPTLSTVTVNTS